MAKKKINKTKIEYPEIEKLGLTIYTDICPHIKSKELKAALSKSQLKLFHKYFGLQTCMRLPDGDTGIFPYDVEAVLVRMFRGEITGTQAFMD